MSQQEEVENMLYVMLGHGVGGGIIKNGKMLTGALGIEEFLKVVKETVQGRVLPQIYNSTQIQISRLDNSVLQGTCICLLEELVNETRTIILYEAPHKLVRTLRDLRETLGNRRMTLCRELTKKHETAFHSTIDDLITHYEKEKPLGECVLVIEGKSRQELKEEAVASWEEISIEEHMEIYEKQGMSRKDAMKQVAKDRGVSKRDIYQYLLNN